MQSTPLKVGLTGGIASGKSMAMTYLEQKGVPVIDADDVVHDLLAGDKELKSRIRDTFGEQVFTSDGQVNRPALGKIVFHNAQLRKLLESWIHPKVRETINRFIERNRNHPLVVAVIPLLFESNLEKNYDEVWLIDVPRDVQLERLMAKRGMSREQAEARIASQLSMQEKLKRARAFGPHLVLNNNAAPQDLFRQLDNRLAQINPK